MVKFIEIPWNPLKRWLNFNFSQKRNPIRSRISQPHQGSTRLAEAPLLPWGQLRVCRGQWPFKRWFISHWNYSNPNPWNPWNPQFQLIIDSYLINTMKSEKSIPIPSQSHDIPHEIPMDVELPVSGLGTVGAEQWPKEDGRDGRPGILPWDSPSKDRGLWSLRIIWIIILVLYIYIHIIIYIQLYIIYNYIYICDITSEYQWIIYLVGGDWNMNGLFFSIQLGMSSSQLTKSLHHFSEG